MHAGVLKPSMVRRTCSVAKLRVGSTKYNGGICANRMYKFMRLLLMYAFMEPYQWKVARVFLVTCAFACPHVKLDIRPATSMLRYRKLAWKNGAQDDAERIGVLHPFRRINMARRARPYRGAPNSAPKLNSVIQILLPTFTMFTTYSCLSLDARRHMPPPHTHNLVREFFLRIYKFLMRLGRWAGRRTHGLGSTW